MLKCHDKKTVLLANALLFALLTWPFLNPKIETSMAGDQKTMSPVQRDEVKDWVHQISEEVQRDYYDQTFHGLDFEQRAHEAEERVKKATTLDEAIGIIAWMLEGLHDSHTFFLPPPRPYEIQHGWSAGMVGDRCYILAVKAGSDAEEKGIRPGDELIELEGFPVTRDTIWKLQYAFLTLAPRSGMTLQVRSPSGNTRTLLVNAKYQKFDQSGYFQTANWFRGVNTKRPSDSRVKELGENLMAWKLPIFALNEKDSDKYVDMAQKHANLILDLRGNPGGSEEVLSHLIASMFPAKVDVGEHVTRKGPKAWEVKPGKHQYTGKLEVLVDAQSASAAEIFARIIQLQKRGAIIGDQSSGSVMQARHEFFRAGSFETFGYGISLTEADILMSDGKSLERTGVRPDEIVLPGPEDFATGRDPVFARAATELGHPMTSEEAGKVFPVLWTDF